MPDVLFVSSLVGALCYGVFTGLLLRQKPRSLPGCWLLAAGAFSTGWCVLQVLYYKNMTIWISSDALWIVEICRDLTWFGLIFSLLGHRADAVSRSRHLWWSRGPIIAVAMTATATILAGHVSGVAASPAVLSKMTLLLFLILSITGLTLIEQLYRNTAFERRWAIKYFCLGIGAIFAYDFALYTDGVLFNHLDAALWSGRAAANGLAVPLLAISATRSREWKHNLFVSRQIAFHSATIVAGGVYLLGMAGAGYYLRAFGGEWGNALRVVLLFAAFLVLISLVGSVSLRSRLRLFLSKHFYREKYDYGEVWLSFTNRLSQSDSTPDELRRSMLRAIVDIMDATGGVMWRRNLTGAFGVDTHWEIERLRIQDIPEGHPLLAALTDDGGIVDLHAAAGQVTVEQLARIPAWLLALPRAWLLMPIVHGDELLAIVLLGESRSGQRISWEDRILLGILGRQAAGYLALMRATDELASARQFEAFNRLSAFLVHDLKNVVAQLSLVNRNSERHLANPEFIADAFDTVGDAVAKMNRMLANLKHTQSGPTEILPIESCVRRAISNVAHRMPVPSLENVVTKAYALGNSDRFVAMLEHLLQNAQEATPEEGQIRVQIKSEVGHTLVEISDTGCGMSPDFVQHRLFRPFETTKGKAGMGIGVYESLHVANAMGGRLSVESIPGEGTTFRIMLPESQEEGSIAPAVEIRELSA